MKLSLGTLVAALGIGALMLAAAKTDGYPPYVTAKTLYAAHDLRGKKAPDLFAEKWFDGKAPDTKGKVVVVDFWATWCGPCRKLIPEMNEWSKKLSKDVVFIGISDEPAATVQGLMKSTPMNYHVAVDTSQKMKNVLGVQGIPHVMVVTPDGVVRWQGWPQDEKDQLTAEKISAIVEAYKAHH